MDWIRAYLVLREVCRQLHGIVPKHQSVQINGIHSVNLMWVLLYAFYTTITGRGALLRSTYVEVSPGVRIAQGLRIGFLKVFGLFLGS